MEVIHDHKRLLYYVEKYGIRDCFSPDLFSYYLENMSLVQFHRDEYIYALKDNARAMYFFLSGKINVCTVLSHGERQLLHFYDHFGILGDTEFFGKINPYITIQAANDSICISMSLIQTREILMKDPVFLKTLAEELADKLMVSSSNSALNIYDQLENRLSSYLIFRADSIKIDGHDVLVFHENLTETSELLGTSYRHLTRTLKRFRESGVIIKIPEGYQLIQLNELRRMAADEFL